MGEWYLTWNDKGYYTVWGTSIKNREEYLEHKEWLKNVIKDKYPYRPAECIATNLHLKMNGKKFGISTYAGDGEFQEIKRWD